MQIVILLGLAVILVAAAAAVQEIIQEVCLVGDPIIIIEKVVMVPMVMFELHILSLR